MKELRPLGSEKLTGDDKIKRILEIANYGRTPKQSITDKAEYVTESKIGGVYGIVKEKDGFYVKKGLNEGSLEYIGGMFMKNKNRYSSYSEAIKHLEFLKGQEALQEATKYVLKQNKSVAPPPAPMEATPPAPSMNDIPPIPSGDQGAPPPEEPAPMGDEMGGEEQGQDNQNLRSGYMQEIQKFAGKLGQELRDQKERLESDDLKYTLNMVISAMDLDKLDDEDLEEVADKFEREEEFEDENGGGEEYAEPAPEPEGGDDLSEVDDLHGFYKRHDVGAEDAEERGEEDDDEFFINRKKYGTNLGYSNNAYGNDSGLNYPDDPDVPVDDKFVWDDDEEDLDETMSKLDEFINSNIDGEEDIFSKYSDLGNDEEEDLSEFFDEGDPSYLDARHQENKYPDNNDGLGDEDISRLEKDELRPRRPLIRTKPVSDKPKFDLDEITNEINKAIRSSLSKYR